VKRGFILAAILGAGLSSIFILPPFKVTESAMSLEIPEHLGGWTTEKVDPTEKEVGSLAKDTRFSKARCIQVREYEYDATGRRLADMAELSIVLSGEDLGNSIHRPERCMGAQGHIIYGSEKTELDIPGSGPMPTRRLLSKLKLPTGEAKDDFIEVNYLTYYFFVGHETITENHSRRTLVDMQDRLKKGQAQKWAYVLVSMPFKAEGSPAAFDKLPDLETANAKVRALLGDISAKNIDWKQIVAVN
jgi:hypothetical protein